ESEPMLYNYLRPMSSLNEELYALACDENVRCLATLNGNSFKPLPQTIAKADGTSISTIPGLVTTEEKAQKKNDVKARSMLVVALPNEHLLTFSQYKDVKTLFSVIQEVKRTVTTSSSLGSQNMAFLLSPGSTNEVDTTNIQVSTVSTPVSTVSTRNNTANLSDATMYAFLSNQPNGSQLVHEDLEQIHEDDLEKMDLKWQLALLSMKERRYFQRTGKKITINGSDTAGYDKTKEWWQLMEQVLIKATWLMMKLQPTWLLWLYQTQRL
nr:ribonuclease H-like domain-containing protein [Tanacetum cinerariifolium]